MEASLNNIASRAGPTYPFRSATRFFALYSLVPKQVPVPPSLVPPSLRSRR